MPAIENGSKGGKPMPLEGIRILEYGIFYAGPGAGAILGDLGAEVIKIEVPNGDPMRHWCEMGGITFEAPDGESMAFHLANRNKMGICLDIEKGKGREIFHRLVERTDVLITNIRKGTKAALGIDYAVLSKVNPRLIMAGISGFGPEGPEADAGAFDPMGQARSGMMFASRPESPAFINLAVLDQSTAIALSHAILTALFMRERKGIGQEVHVSLYSTALWLLTTNLSMAGAISVDPTPPDRFGMSPLRNYFCCRDEKWLIGSHHPEQKYWPTFCRVTGQTAILEDPRFADISQVVEERPELVKHFDRVFATKPRAEWLALFKEHSLMFGPVNRIMDVLEDPQARINGYVADLEHRELGRIKGPGYPVHFSAAATQPQRLTPRIGEHTDHIMESLGFSRKEIEALRDAGTIQ